MGQAEERAALDVGVTAVADTTGVKGMFYRAAASASNIILTIPVASATDPRKPMQGRWINFFSSAENVQYAFSRGTAGVVLTYNALVTAGTGSATAGATIPFGQIVSKIIPSDANFISIITSGGTGHVELYVSEGPG